MDAGRSPTRIRLVPRPRGPATDQAEEPRDRTFIRSVRRVAPRSTRGVLMRVLRDVREPEWSAEKAGRALVAHVDGDLMLLRSARVHLIVATVDRRPLSAARALAALDVAIAEVEAQQPQSPRPGDS